MFNEGGEEIKRLRKLFTVRCLGLRERGGKRGLNVCWLTDYSSFCFLPLDTRKKKSATVAPADWPQISRSKQNASVNLLYFFASFR